MTTKTTLDQVLRDAVASMSGKFTSAKTCSVVKVNGRTAGYVVFGPRSLRVDVPEGGKIVRYKIKTKKDVTVAVAAMRRRAQKLAAKSPKTTKRVKAPMKMASEPIS